MLRYYFGLHMYQITIMSLELLMYTQTLLASLKIILVQSPILHDLRRTTPELRHNQHNRCNSMKFQHLNHQKLKNPFYC